MRKRVLVVIGLWSVAAVASAQQQMQWCVVNTNGGQVSDCFPQKATCDTWAKNRGTQFSCVAVPKK